MELTASHAIQGLMLIATIAGGYAVVKSNLQRVMQDLEVFHKNFDKFKSTFDARLDDALEHRNREMATLQAEVKVMKSQISHLNAIHNGKHPSVKE